MLGFSYTFLQKWKPEVRYFFFKIYTDLMSLIDIPLCLRFFLCEWTKKRKNMNFDAYNIERSLFKNKNQNKIELFNEQGRERYNKEHK